MNDKTSLCGQKGTLMKPQHTHTHIHTSIRILWVTRDLKALITAFCLRNEMVNDVGRSGLCVCASESKLGWMFTVIGAKVNKKTACGLLNWSAWCQWFSGKRSAKLPLCLGRYGDVYNCFYFAIMYYYTTTYYILLWPQPFPLVLLLLRCY